MTIEQHIILKWTVDEKQNIRLTQDVNCQPEAGAIALFQLLKNNPSLAKAFLECDISNYTPMPVERTFQ